MSLLPHTSDKFVYHIGAKQVKGEFTLIYQSTDRVQVYAQKVEHKGKTFNLRANFVRLPDGSFVEGFEAPVGTRHSADTVGGPAQIRNSVDYSDPTPAQRRNLVEAAKAFARNYYTEDEDGAGEVAAAQRGVEAAQNEINSLTAKLAQAADRRDQAQARLDQARAQADYPNWDELAADRVAREHTAKLLDVSADRVTIDETGIHVAP